MVRDGVSGRLWFAHPARVIVGLWETADAP